MRTVVVITFLLWLLPVATLQAARECQIVSAPEVSRMIQDEHVLLVHTLSRIEYAIQHIPGSINIQVDEVGSSDKLPADKSTPLIFYCMGVKCPYSERACREAVAVGYTDTYWFRGGIPEWYKFNYPMQVDQALVDIPVNKIDPEKIMQIIAEENPFILDVRPTGWKEDWGYMKNSVFIPLVELDAKLQHVPMDRKIIVTDGYMKQSINAARYLLNKGYQVVGVMKGGIARWDKEGYPLGDISTTQFP